MTSIVSCRFSTFLTTSRAYRRCLYTAVDRNYIKTSKLRVVHRKCCTMEGDPGKVSESEWKKRLSAEQYHVTRQKGTEMAFTGKYHDFKGDGTYHCVCCGTQLFDSDHKYDSGSGWPSFFTANKSNIATATDKSLRATRTEVLCAKCNAHQGHVFKDGPEPTGLRYCINSASIKFKPKDK